ncbi:MAG: hypothetical protein Q7R32_07920 [Dehalococcoidia bacterium]|nr:hypothetical protein [Dehalococcoidia bacterium]
MPESGRAGLEARILREYRTVAVVGSKCQVPDHTLTMVPAATAEEAHYLTAILNSSPCTAVVQGYVSLHPSPHVLEHVAIPRFDASNPLHQSLAALSQRAHRAAIQRKTGEAETRRVEEEIDRVAAQLWGITDEELEEIGQALADLGTPGPSQ